MNQKTKKIIIITAIALAGLLVSAGLGYLVTKLIVPKDDNKTASSAVELKRVDSAVKIATDLKQLPVGLNSGHTVRDIVVIDGNILYKKEGSKYTVGVIPDDIAQIIETSSQDGTAYDKINQFLTDKGLVKTTDSSTEIEKITNYDSDNTICSSSIVTIEKKHTYTVRCASKESVLNAYTVIDKLALLPELAIKTDSVTIGYTKKSENNKSLVILEIYNKDEPVVAYFAAIDDAWEFVAKKPYVVSDTDPNANGYSKEDFNNSISAKADKYGDFLTKNIQ